MAVPTTFTTPRNPPLDDVLLATDVDGDALQFAVTRTPRSGTVTITNAATGAFRYTPAAGFTGSVSFTFTASDGTLTSKAATVTVNVVP